MSAKLRELSEGANRLGAQACALLEAKGLGAPDTRTQSSEEVLVSFRQQTSRYKGTAPLLKVLYDARGSYRLTLALDHKLSSWWLHLRPTDACPTSELVVPVSPRAALDLEAKIEGLLASAALSYLLDLPKLETFQVTLADANGETLQVEVRAVDAAKAILRAEAFVGPGMTVKHIQPLSGPPALRSDEIVCAFK